MMSFSHKKLKRISESGYFRELTFSCYRGKPLLTNDSWRRQLSREIDLACNKYKVSLHAFVFMPNHVHLLIYPEHGKIVPKFLGQFKGSFSRRIKRILAQNNSPLLKQLTVRERPGKFCFRYWQEGGGYDRSLYELRTIEASINYIHMNPVRKDLCRRAIDWKWSSARWYLTGELDQDLPKLKQLPREVLDHPDESI